MEKPDRRELDNTAVTSASAASSPSLRSPNPDLISYAPFEVGSVIAARYEILQKLGQGGMGAVYQARDRELDRIIALKVVRPDLAHSPSSLKRFKQELILSRQVTHRNVVRIYDLGESDGVKYITMEYVDGQDLRYAIRAKLSIEETVNIVRQICQGLQAAHAEGVVHRDLKPQNILRDKNGRVVVMDFGLARSLETAGLTQSGALVGTLEYMSPEQATGQQVDHRSDIFALGIIFYELLTGEAPYKADSAIASLVKRTQEDAVPPMELDQSIPPEISAIVSKCLNKNVFERYQSADDVIRDLNRCQNIGPTLENYSISRHSTLARPVSGRKTFSKIWFAVPALLVLIAAAVWIAKVVTRPPAKHQPVSMLIADFQNQTSDPIFDGTLEPSFSIAMEGASFINAYDRAAAKRVAAQIQPKATALDDYMARLVASREGINVVIGGSIARRDNGYAVSVKATDALTGKTLAEEEQTAGEKNAVLSVIGKLASDVRKKLGDTTPESTRLAAAETFTADSLESSHEYALGQQAQWAGNYDEAVKHYSRAIEIDQNMGRAYAGIAAMYANTGRREQADNYYKLAMQHMDRMSEREKFRTRAGYYLGVRQDPQKAADELSGLLEKYPDDTSGRSNLALAYFYERDMAKAVEEGKRAVDLNPKSVQQRNNLALYAMYAGNFDMAQSEAGNVMQLNPAFEKAYIALALSQFAQGKLGEARDTYQKLQSINPPSGESRALMGLADLSLYQGKTTEAIQTLQKGVATDAADKKFSAAQAAKLALLSYAHLLRGETAAALASADKAVAASKSESVLYPAAMVYLRAGKGKKAIEIAQDLEGRLDPSPQIYGKLIEAEVQLQDGHAREAVRVTQEAQKISDSWLGRFTLGKAYLASESYTDAYAQFDTCLRRRGEATAVFLDDVPSYHVLPEVYYYLGRAQQGLHSPGAADSFNTYLQIKKDADKDPLVADARKRMTAN